MFFNENEKLLSQLLEFGTTLHDNPNSVNVKSFTISLCELADQIKKACGNLFYVEINGRKFDFFKNDNSPIGTHNIDTGAYFNIEEYDVITFIWAIATKIRESINNQRINISQLGQLLIIIYDIYADYND